MHVSILLILFSSFFTQASSLNVRQKANCLQGRGVGTGSKSLKIARKKVGSPSYEALNLRNGAVGESMILTVEDGKPVLTSREQLHGKKNVKGLIAIFPGTDMPHGPKTFLKGDEEDRLRNELADMYEDIDDGHIKLYGTGYKSLHIRDVDSLLYEGDFKSSPLYFYRPNIERPWSTELNDLVPVKGDLLPWDFTVHRFSNKKFGFAGALTATESVPSPNFKDHKGLRRIRIYKEVGENRWLDVGTLLPERIDPNDPWLGHCYGAKLDENKAGKTEVYYEKVVATKYNAKHEIEWLETRIFKREIKGPEPHPGALGEEMEVLRPEGKSAFRIVGPLVEGPIPMGDLGLSFASGSFRGNYGGHHIDPVSGVQMTEDQKSYANLLESLLKKYKLRGAGRWSTQKDLDHEFYRLSDGTYLVKFHTYLKGQKSSRIIVYGKLKATIGEDGVKRLEIVELDGKDFLR